jgi:mono/diheme cytochrome c family protein
MERDGAPDGARRRARMERDDAPGWSATAPRMEREGFSRASRGMGSEMEQESMMNRSIVVRWGRVLARVVVAVVSCAVVCACSNPGQAGRPDAARESDAAAEQAQTEQTRLERGKYLALVGGCNDCHTPFKLGPNGPEPDMSRMLSGHPQELVMPPPPAVREPWQWVGSATNTAFAGPWGVSYAINLTPDQETGIGLWSEQVFVNAIKTGRHMGVGRPIMPPMPWPTYSQMSDDDLKAIFAYLKTVEPRKNKAPEGVVNEPPAAGAPTATQ